MRFVVKELVAKEVATVVEEALDDVMRKTVHNTQFGAQYLIYNIVERVMLDLP